MNKATNLVVYSIWYINAYLIPSHSHVTSNGAISGHLASKISLHVLGAILRCSLFLLYIGLCCTFFHILHFVPLHIPFLSIMPSLVIWRWRLGEFPSIFYFLFFFYPGR